MALLVSYNGNVPNNRHRAYQKRVCDRVPHTTHALPCLVWYFCLGAISHATPAKVFTAWLTYI